jgi:hypothetical protein
MRFRLHTLLIVLAVAPPAFAAEPVVVSVRTENGPARLKVYAAQFAVTPDKAQSLAEKFHNSLPEDERPHAGLVKLHGMVNDEYVFSHPHKKWFNLVGYWVNANTGKARYATLEIVHAKYGERFPDGHVPFRELTRLPIVPPPDGNRSPLPRR